MKPNIKMKLWDASGTPIGTAKGTPDEIGKKVSSWLEKIK